MRSAFLLASLVVFGGCSTSRTLPLKFAYQDTHSVPLGNDLFKSVPGVPAVVRYTGFSGSTLFLEESHTRTGMDSEGVTREELVKKEMRIEPFSGDSTALIEGVTLQFLSADTKAVTFKILDYPEKRRPLVVKKWYGSKTGIFLDDSEILEGVVTNEDKSFLYVSVLKSGDSGKGPSAYPAGSVVKIEKTKILSLTALSSD